MSDVIRNGGIAGDRPANRPKKEGTLVSAFIEQAAYDALLRHCDATGQSKTKAIERAILNYCKGGRTAENSE